MTSLHLSALSLRSFRAFCSDQTIYFGARPGLNLIMGSNGLGKTSLLEALEWNITGQVRRMRHLSKADLQLVHIGEDSESLKVSLQFSKNVAGLSSSVSFDRTISYGPDVSSLTNAYAERIASLYHLTHHLSQSSALRAQNSERREFYQRVRDAQHAFDLESVHERLVRTGTTRAINEARDHIEHRIDLIRKDKDYLAQLRAMLSLQSDAEVLSPEEYTERRKILLSQHQNLLGDLRKWLSWTASEVLTRIQSKIVEWQGLVDRQSHWLAKRENRESLKAKIESLRAETNSLHIEKNELENALLSFRQTEACIASHERLRDIEKLLATLDTEEKSLQAQLYELTQQIRELSEKIQSQHTEYSRWVAYDDLLKRYKEMRSLSAAELASINSLEALFQEFETLEKRMSTGQETVKHLLALRVDRLVSVRKTDEAFLQAKEKSEAIQQLLGELQKHVHEESMQCPLCLTNFAYGQLKQRLGLAMSSDPALQFLAVQRSESQSALSSLELEISGTELLVQQLHEEIEQVKSKIAENSSSDALDPLNPLEWHKGMRLLRQRQESNQVLAGQLWTELTAASLSEHSGRETSIDFTLQRQQQQIESLDNLQAVLNERVLEVELKLETIQNQAAKLREEKERLSETDQSFEQAIAAQSSLAQRFGISSVLELENRLQYCQLSIDAKDFSLGTLTSQLGQDEIEQQLAFGNLSATAQTLQDSQHAVTVFTGINSQLLGIENGLRAYQEQERIRETQADLQRLADEHNCQAETLESLLEEKTAALASERETIEHFAQQRSTVTLRLKEMLEDQQGKLMQPLEKTYKEVSRLLLYKHQAYEPELEWETKHGKSELEMRARIKGQDCHPVAVRSEGEQAADHLCFQIAASLNYPWCHWRALVLDDPLQHNDAIHTSAYADLIRRLILEREYQIFHSTHDIDQARYLAQKCRRAGIPVHRIMFVGRDRNGPIIEQEPRNEGLLHGAVFGS